MAADLTQLELPIVQAPMAGGPSTPALAAAVCEAGGLGFLAAGYKSVAAVRADIEAVRERTRRPFGVNVFSPPGEAAPGHVVSAYARTLASDGERYGVAPGDPRFDDDGYEDKLALVAEERPGAVSFTFGCPAAATVAALRAEQISVWVTVTSPLEARQAEAVGADALIAQGTESGGHRGYFVDDGSPEEYGLLVLSRLLAAQTALPLVAAGGIMDGAGVAAVLCAGATAAQLGSALMLTPEAGTSAAHRRELAEPGPTRLTRAFSGRTARGIVNRFMQEHDADAPRAYPQVHHLTAPIRAAARELGDAQAVNLWAGQAHWLARQKPAGQLVREIAEEAAAIVAGVERRLPSPRR